VVLRPLLVLGALLRALLLSRRNISISIRSGPSAHRLHVVRRTERKPVGGKTANLHANSLLRGAKSVRHMAHIRFFLTLLWFTN
jgi:hypothetical protein